jgi:hypothetical protein
MRALPCTKHRHAVMALVLDAKIVTVPNGDSWQWRRDVNDLFTVDGTITTDTLTSAESRALGQLFDAKLIRISAAAPRSGRSKGVRRVFATDAGRDWWTKGYRARRGCTNGNRRGNAEARRRRRQWLLDTFGDGTRAACALALSPDCAGLVTFETISADRIVPGYLGGTYRRDNIQPACGPCQSHQGGQHGQAAKQLVDAAACST